MAVKFCVRYCSNLLSSSLKKSFHVNKDQSSSPHIERQLLQVIMYICRKMYCISVQVSHWKSSTKQYNNNPQYYQVHINPVQFSDGHFTINLTETRQIALDVSQCLREGAMGECGCQIICREVSQYVSRSRVISCSREWVMTWCQHASRLMMYKPFGLLDQHLLKPCWLWRWQQGRYVCTESFCKSTIYCSLVYWS